MKRALHEADLGSLEKLTVKNVCCMLEFAQCHQDWNIPDWSRVIFSDESKINRFQFDGRAW